MIKALFKRAFKSRNHYELVKFKALHGLQSDFYMPVVNRIKAAAENADSHQASVTLRISLTLVSPANTLSQPSSRNVFIPFDSERFLICVAF